MIEEDKRDRLEIIYELVETRKKIFDVTELADRYRAALEKIGAINANIYASRDIANEALHPTQPAEANKI